VCRFEGVNEESRQNSCVRKAPNIFDAASIFHVTIAAARGLNNFALALCPDLLFFADRIPGAQISELSASQLNHTTAPCSIGNRWATRNEPLDRTTRAKQENEDPSTARNRPLPIGDNTPHPATR
jgi:hypothetical protein